MAVNDLNLFFFSAFITLTTVSKYRPLTLNSVILGYLWQNSDSNWWERKVSTAAEENVCEVSSFPNNPTVYTHFVILNTRSSKSSLLWNKHAPCIPQRFDIVVSNWSMKNDENYLFIYLFECQSIVLLFSSHYSGEKYLVRWHNTFTVGCL